MQVRHILHGKGRDVVAIAAGASIADAARLLTDKRIGALVVKDAIGAPDRHHFRTRPGARHRAGAARRADGQWSPIT